MQKSPIILAVLPLILAGCLARTAMKVATLPVRATAQAVDRTTTSRGEADRNAGRKLRRNAARERRERRERARRAEAAGFVS